MARTRLNPAQARRAVLAAQGLARRGSSSADSRAVRGVVRRLGAVQIDSVNVLVRAHYLPVASRVGDYDRSLLDAAAGRAPRALFEYWGHEAALLPVDMHPLLRWRMARAHEDAWGGMVRVQREQPDLVRAVAEHVRTRGPITASELEALLAVGDRAARERWGWNWSAVKRALEFLFWSGEITSAGRDATFRRRYAVAQDVLPRAVLDLPTPSREQAQRALVVRAARAMGVATLADLADYFRMPVAQTRDAVSGLLADGELAPVEVEGWPPAYATGDLKVPRRADASALLAPFDPLIWFRPRTERLFGMRYRVEIYTPAERRVHGYYVLPFLHEDHLVARVDLKADRPTERLLVRSAHPEGEVGAASVAALAGQLHRMAGWLGLGEVHVAPSGELAGRLRAAVRVASGGL